MRLLHTADWHLGKLLHGVRLTEDQSYILDQLIEIARDFRPDAILISGDIYDRAVPPPEAVDLLDDVLYRLVQELPETVVLMIAGNHDSPERLQFGSRLFQQQRLYVYGTLPREITGIRLRDEHGPVHIYGLPYTEPPVVRQRHAENGGETEVTDHDSASRSLLAEIRQFHPQEERAVVLAHAHVAGGEESESERPLFIGGAGAVDVSCFDGFHYVALGHLHRPQQIGAQQVRYSGSLMKYSFSEAADQKGVYLIEMDGRGDCRVQSAPLTPRRDLRRIKGYFEALLDRGESNGNPDDYLEITLLDDGPVLDPIDRLRRRYPNVLNVRREVAAATSGAPGTPGGARELDPADLFSQFWSQVEKEPLSIPQANAFAEIVAQTMLREREVLA
jgi:exonuclease SbcD